MFFFPKKEEKFKKILKYKFIKMIKINDDCIKKRDIEKVLVTNKMLEDHNNFIKEINEHNKEQDKRLKEALRIIAECDKEKEENFTS